MNGQREHTSKPCIAGYFLIVTNNLSFNNISQGSSREPLHSLSAVAPYSVVELPTLKSRFAADAAARSDEDADDCADDDADEDAEDGEGDIHLR